MLHLLKQLHHRHHNSILIRLLLLKHIMQLDLQHLPLLNIPDVYGIESAFGAFHVAEEVAVDSA